MEWELEGFGQISYFFPNFLVKICVLFGGSTSGSGVLQICVDFQIRHLQSVLKIKSEKVKELKRKIRKADKNRPIETYIDSVLEAFSILDPETKSFVDAIQKEYFRSNTWKVSS